MKRAAVAIVAFIALPSVGAAQSPQVRDLLQLERELDLTCRGSSSEDRDLRDRVCDIRGLAVKMLERQGYCWGEHGQIGADMRWHRCGPDSQRSRKGSEP